MERYHKEKHIMTRRAKLRQWLDRVLGLKPRNIESGRFRKTLRCGGCGKARCQICHSYKFPKREPTRQEKQPWQTDE